MPVTITITVKVIIIVLMVMDTMGPEPFLLIKVSVTIGTMLNVNGVCDGDGYKTTFNCN